MSRICINFRCAPDIPNDGGFLDRLFILQFVILIFDVWDIFLNAATFERYQHIGCDISSCHY